MVEVNGHGFTAAILGFAPPAKSLEIPLYSEQCHTVIRIMTVWHHHDNTPILHKLLWLPVPSMRELKTLLGTYQHI